MGFNRSKMDLNKMIRPRMWKNACMWLGVCFFFAQKECEHSKSESQIHAM